MSGNRGNRGQMPAPPVDNQLLAQNDDASKNTMVDKAAEADDAVASGLLADMEAVAKPDLEPANDSSMTVKSRKKGIEVRATRPGYIYNSRKVEGDVFMISSEEELGSWMELTDVKAEAKRQVADKAKVAAARKAKFAVEDEDAAE